MGDSSARLVLFGDCVDLLSKLLTWLPFGSLVLAGAACTHFYRHHRVVCRDAGAAGHALAIRAANAAKAGDAETLVWLCRNGAAADGLASMAAQAGHLGCLRALHQHGVPLGDHVADYAARNGHLDILEWAHALGYSGFGTMTSGCAAARGDIGCLEWLHAAGCLRGAGTCCHAASAGQLRALAWLVGSGCPWDRDQCLEVAADPAVRQWIRSVG